MGYNLLVVKNQKGFHLLYVIFIAAILAIIAFAGLNVAKGSKNSDNKNKSQTSSASQSAGGSGPNYKALAACGSNKDILNTVPVGTSNIYQILPLGNQGVPDHTLPTDHIYFGFRDSSVPVPLYSPGKIVVTNITFSGETIVGHNNRPNDYEITFSACKGVNFDFAHIESLSSALQAVAPGANDSSCTQHNQAVGVTTFYCNKALDLVMQPGDSIGSTAGNANIGAFDFGAHDTSYKDPGYIDDKWNIDRTAVCALDYFSADAKSQLYALIKRAQEPRCGQIGQDKPGTLQGGWFATNDYSQGYSQWNKQLSLVHNNIDPSVGEMAIGGTITDPSVYAFNPKHSGTLNREPSETKADTIYCYQSEATDAMDVSASPGKILMELINNYQMKAEHQSGSCGASESFSSPTTYYR